MICIRSLAAATAVTVGLSASSIAGTVTSAPAQMAIDTLKSVYLECERAAINGRLAVGDIMLCSVIYEEVKRRAFGGDFARLKAWADEHLRPPNLANRSAGARELNQ
jgi:hypothetical protein